MSAAIQSLVKAYRFKVILEVTGQTNPGYDLFLLVAKELGVQVEEIEIPKDYLKREMAWASDHTTKNLRAWIPNMKKRTVDMHVLVPFSFKYHITELQKHDQAFPMPKVDNLYLLLIWSECFGELNAPLSARIFKDLLAWESTGIISAYRYRSSISDEIRTVNRQALSLSPTSQRYLGFKSGSEGYKLCENSSLKNHAFNHTTREMSRSFANYGTGPSSSSIYMVQNYKWDADKVAVILKNALFLHYYPALGTKEELEKTYSCLNLRLEGETDEEIAEQLKFPSKEDYEKWLISRAIDIDNKLYRNPYSDWNSACKEFGITPSPAIVESLLGPSPISESVTMTEDSRKPIVRTAVSAELNKSKPSNDMIFSQDFRSINLNGKVYGATERQANVLSILYDNWEAGTPFIAQSTVIQEVYPEASTNNLRKLFSNDELWNVLIRQGSKKGTIGFADFSKIEVVNRAKQSD